MAQRALYSSLPAGKVIASRFSLESPAGRGGLSAVYRARDSLSGQPVALELFPLASPATLQRFTREAEQLAALEHPGIAPHVAHGITPEGQPFFATQWVEGEDLAHRLERQPLSLTEALAVLVRAAEALAAAHRQGLVHRHLEPAFLLLRASKAEDAVLLGFGLAHDTALTPPSLESDVLLGSSQYMAPELASSQGEPTPASDIFSLGCILYECLTGQPPFSAAHFSSVLTKLLFAQPAPLRSLRPDLPEALQPLMDRMLVKDPNQRLGDAQALLDSLTVLESVPELERALAAASTRRTLRAGAEPQLVTLLLTAALPLEAERNALREALAAGLAPHGAQVEALSDGKLVATLVPEQGSDTAQTPQMAGCALALKQRWPQAAMVLTTGRATFHQGLPTGEALERASEILHQLENLPSPYVLVDEVTAGLLGHPYQLSRLKPDLYLLRHQLSNADETRLLMGRPTPCVGREQELAALKQTFTTCVEQRAARALLVVAPAGIGKSRLRHEFLRRLERQGHRLLVLFGRGDPLGVGSAYGLLGQALRRLCGVAGNESAEAQRNRLRQRLGQSLPHVNAQEVVEFLGELCGLSFPDEHSPRLRAARTDPELMGAQVGRALVAFLHAECARQPVMLVLEDVHWGDAPSVRLVDEALRELASQPLLVLATARPEVHDLFPGLWARALQQMPLRRLTRRACAQLVYEVLGPQVSEELVERIVEQAAGNALFLEELIRQAAEGRGEVPPGSVLAMLQARLSRLETGARQVLLAGSLFGRSFWAGGVRALLEPEMAREEVVLRLRELVEQEWVEPQATSRFPAEAEYRFRHALVREAAYGLVPEGQRADAHRLAGAWLEQVGESDPRVLAEHYKLGKQPERAIRFYIRAAEWLFDRNDMKGTLRCVEAAMLAGAKGGALARLRAFQALALFWWGDLVRLQELGSAVLPELRAGSPSWCRLIGGMIVGSACGGQPEQTEKLSRLLLTTAPQPGASTAYLEAVAWLYTLALWSGARPQALAFLDRMEEVAISVVGYDGAVRGWMSYAYGASYHFLEAQPREALLMAEQGMQAFLEVGAVRNALAAQSLAGLARAALGDWRGAEAHLQEAAEAAHNLEQQFLLAQVQLHLGWVLAQVGEPAMLEQAHTLARGWAENTEADMWQQGVAHAVLARVAASRGVLDEAESHARQATERLAPFASYRLWARTTLSAVLRAQGRTPEAREQALLAVQELGRLGGGGASAVAVHLSLAEACLAQGDSSAGEAALRQAVQCLRERADDLHDESAAERFFHRVPENARTLQLARERWGQGWSL